MKRLVPVLAVAAAALAACTAPGTPRAGKTPTNPTPLPSASQDVGCPVDLPTLEKAFKASVKVSNDFVLGKGLKDPRCYSGFAIATTQPTNIDPVRIVFRFDPEAGRWNAVAGGIEVCKQYLPWWINAHLQGCD